MMSLSINSLWSKGLNGCYPTYVLIPSIFFNDTWCQEPSYAKDYKTRSLKFIRNLLRNMECKNYKDNVILPNSAFGSNIE